MTASRFAVGLAREGCCTGADRDDRRDPFACLIDSAAACAGCWPAPQGLALLSGGDAGAATGSAATGCCCLAGLALPAAIALGSLASRRCGTRADRRADRACRCAGAAVAELDALLAQTRRDTGRADRLFRGRDRRIRRIAPGPGPCRRRRSADAGRRAAEGRRCATATSSPGWTTARFAVVPASLRNADLEAGDPAGRADAVGGGRADLGQCDAALRHRLGRLRAAAAAAARPTGAGAAGRGGMRAGRGAAQGPGTIRAFSPGERQPARGRRPADR